MTVFRPKSNDGGNIAHAQLLTGLEHRVIGSMRELLADVVDCAAEQSVVAAQTREPVVDELGIGSHCAFELLSLAAGENFIDR